MNLQQTYAEYNQKKPNINVDVKEYANYYLDQFGTSSLFKSFTKISLLWCQDRGN